MNSCQVDRQAGVVAYAHYLYRLLILKFSTHIVSTAHCLMSDYVPQRDFELSNPNPNHRKMRLLDHLRLFVALEPSGKKRQHQDPMDIKAVDPGLSINIVETVMKRTDEEILEQNLRGNALPRSA